MINMSHFPLSKLISFKKIIQDERRRYLSREKKKISSISLMFILWRHDVIFITRYIILTFTFIVHMTSSSSVDALLMYFLSTEIAENSNKT